MKLIENRQNIYATKSALQSYAKILSDIKGNLTPHQKNWEEFSLKVYSKGLTTTPVPIKRNNYFDALDLNINLVENKLKIFSSGERLSIDLVGQSQMEFYKELKIAFEDLQIQYEYDSDKLSDDAFSNYNREDAQYLWKILREVYFSMLKFKGGKFDETSNINFWAHHFDLAMLTFNGNIIPGQDINNWDYSREQMNFGFSFGDEEIEMPYLYVTQYPFSEEMLSLDLKNGGFWHTKGWNGAVLVIDSQNKLTNLYSIIDEFFTSVYNHSKKILSK